MEWTRETLLTLAVPAVLGSASGWVTRGGALVRVLCVTAAAIAILGILLLANRRIALVGLVGFLAPSYQITLALVLMRLFRKHYGREMNFFLFETVTRRELYPDSRLSSLYFAAALAVPLVAFGLLVD